jgi:hypothetical protein
MPQPSSMISTASSSSSRRVTIRSRPVGFFPSSIAWTAFIKIRQIASFFERFEASDKVLHRSIQSGATFLVYIEYLEHRAHVALEQRDVIQSKGERVIKFVSHAGGKSPDRGEFF